MGTWGWDKAKVCRDFMPVSQMSGIQIPVSTQRWDGIPMIAVPGINSTDVSKTEIRKKPEEVLWMVDPFSTVWDHIKTKHLYSKLLSKLPCTEAGKGGTKPKVQSLTQNLPSRCFKWLHHTEHTHWRLSFKCFWDKYANYIKKTPENIFSIYTRGVWTNRTWKLLLL